MAQECRSAGAQKHRLANRSFSEGRGIDILENE